ncbi:MAG: hypothetical protein IJU75_00110 [Clostridia bacterium]|nr:hypothetical protein [Clostridia bacterium]
MVTVNGKNAVSVLCDRKGISRAVAIMIVLIAILLVLVSIPIYIHFRSIYREMECMTSLDSAKRQMIDQFLFQFGDASKDELKEHVGYVMNGWDDLCPGGGTVYIVEDDDPTLEMPYRLVCGVHGEDARERTRLNADYTLSVIRDRVKYELIKGNPVPETVTVRLNGEDLVAKLVTTNQMVKRGTTYSADKGTVAYYGVAGAGFDETYGVADGTVCYFGFADDWFCANWNPVKSWSGDSWLLLTPSGEILPG